MDTQAQVPLLTGEECRARRAGLELSRAELARRCYCDPGTLWRLERGDFVSPLTRRRIDAALGQLEAQVAA